MFSVLVFTFLIETVNSCFYVYHLREPVGLEWNFRIRFIKLDADVKGVQYNVDIMLKQEIFWWKLTIQFIMNYFLHEQFEFGSNTAYM